MATVAEVAQLLNEDWQLLSVADYLRLEQDGQVRHEYVAGQLYAMSGASRKHGLIVGALLAALRPAARQKRCQLFTSDMKVRIQHEDEVRFYYPDLVLSCDADDREDYYLNRPCLIIEVLSPSTERLDRHEKFWAYTEKLTTLQEYLLVAQDRRWVEMYRRSEKHWLKEVYTQGEIRLGCLESGLTVDSIYEDVDFNNVSPS